MELFLIKGIVESRQYMADKDEREEDLRLVRADGPGEAEEKYKDYWERKNSPYSISYYAKVVSVTGVIE
jgi:hypothetical protein